MFFSSLEFNGKGECTHIPAQESIPKRARVQSYVTTEKYGHIWVYPEEETLENILEVPSLEGEEITYKIGNSFFRTCHHHITMINGIDPQHLKTVHNIHMGMNLKFDESKINHINIELSGKLLRQIQKKK